MADSNETPGGQAPTGVSTTSSTALAAPAPDTKIQAYREMVTATLAFSMIGLFALAFIAAFFVIDDATQFGNMKDMLSMLTPIVGMVLGFYFNKASTERRAESAEEGARAATEAARQASEERAQAQVEATQATQSLNDVSTAADALLASNGEPIPEPADDSSEGGVMSSVTRGATSRSATPRGAPPADSASRIRLEEALKRARRGR